MGHLVFVYGTLKNGCHGMGKFIAKGKTIDPFLLFDGGFPMVLTKDHPAVTGIPASAHAHVLGEVYECDDEHLGYLDSYEGYPSHYGRIQIPVAMDTQSDVKAWMYIGSEKAGAYRVREASPILPDAKGEAEWPIARPRPAPVANSADA